MFRCGASSSPSAGCTWRSPPRCCAGRLRRGISRGRSSCPASGCSIWPMCSTPTPRSLSMWGGRGARGRHRVPPAPRGAGGHAAPGAAAAGLRAGLVAARGDRGGRGRSHQPGGDLPLGGSPAGRCRAGDPALRRSALPPGDPGVHGHRLPGAVGALGALDGGSAAGQGRRLPHRRHGARGRLLALDELGTRVRESGRGSPCCWAPRATDSRRRPSITPISPCGSRCPTGWTR